MQNHSEIAEFLWKIADLIKDDYDAKDYENVILPFTLLAALTACCNSLDRQCERQRRNIKPPLSRLAMPY